MNRLGKNSSPQNVGCESLTVGLYDVTNVSTIAPLISETTKIPDDEAWKLKTTSNERFLVVASCKDLTVFTLGNTAEYMFTTALEGNITDFVILGNSGFLVVIVDKRRVVILSLEKKEAYLNMEIPFRSDFVRCSHGPNSCFLTFGSLQGQLHTISLNSNVAECKENNRIENSQSDQIIEFFTKAVQNTVTRNVNMNGISDDICLITNGPLQSYCSTGKINGFWLNGFFSPEFIHLEQNTKYLRIRDTGRFVLFLSADGFIHVFDPLTACFWHKFDVKAKTTTRVLDFIIVENNSFEVPTLFAIVVKNGEKTEMMIYDRTKEENCFSLECSQKTTLFAYSGSDRVLMSIEEISGDTNDYTQSKISIRQISQSRPEMRFDALLKHNRFDEAEKFAKMYNLDIQKVFEGRVFFLMDACDSDDDAYKMLIKTMDLIVDHNMVADTYFSLVMMSSRLDRIRTYLSNAKKRRLTDMDCLKKIEVSCFILATYQIISGPNNDLNEKIWSMFVDALHGTDRWIDIYLEFISTSAITEARVIFARHGKSVMDYMTGIDVELEESEARLDSLFSSFMDSLTSDISSWSCVIEHVTVDLLPAGLIISDLLVPKIENLILKLIHSLEYRDTSNWPDNAITVTNNFENMTTILTENSITPTDQSFLALNGKILCVQGDDTSTPISRIKKIYYDLKDIKHLKIVYECNISYGTYKHLTSEEICHKILQNALTNPNLTHAKIEKFVKPFMAERHLNQDQTIYNYIQIMSGAATSNANMFGWEDQCVQLCDSLSDESRRCRSIISIASSAKVPWPVKLKEAVDKILKSTKLSRSDIEEMQIVCRRTELIKLLSAYGYDRTFIDVFTENDAKFDIIIVIRCILNQTEKPDRFVDCINVLKLLSLVQRTDWRNSLTIEYARSQAIIQMIKSGEMVVSTINYIDSLEENERVKSLNLVLSFIESVADTPAIGDNIQSREEMLGVGADLLCYYSRSGSDSYEYMDNLRMKLALISDLQKCETTAVLLSDFNDEKWEKRQLSLLRKLDIPFSQKLMKCKYLGIEYDRFLERVLGQAHSENDFTTMLNVFVDTVDSIGDYIPATKDAVDNLCDLLSVLIANLPTVTPDTTPEVERADAIAYVVKRLSGALRRMISSFPESLISDDLGFLLQIEAYIYLCERVIKQSLRGEDTHSSDSDRETASEFTSTEGKIYGFGRRLGIYDFSSDPALFEGVQCLIHIAAVAPSVGRFDAESDEDKANEFRGNWEQLTMFLSMHSQELLDISTRVFASSLGCWAGVWRRAICDMGMSITTTVERMLQQKKFDTWHAVTLLSGLPADQLQQKITDLRSRSGAKRSVSAQLNFLDLALCMSFITGKTDMIPTIISTFEQKFMMKQMSKEGIRVTIAQNDVLDKIITQAAELPTPLEPAKLLGYVKNIVEKFIKGPSVSVSEYMVRYATLLIRKASTAGNAPDSQSRCDMIEKYLILAGSALHIIDNGDCVCNYLISLLYHICPYNYEVIQFISKQIGDRAVPGSEDYEFFKNLQNILNFLWSYNRMNHISSKESEWYTTRDSRIVREEKAHDRSNRVHDPLGFNLRMAYEGVVDNEHNSSTDMSQDHEMVYERNEVLYSNMPPLASKRLPVHVFLLRTKAKVDDTVLPIIEAELSIYNVILWQSAVREVSWLVNRFSRTHLLSNAIFAHANKHAVVEQCLLEKDKLAISQLLSSNNQRAIVISTISLLFRKIMLSDAKIELLQMGVNMAESWLLRDDLEPPMSNEERESIEEQCARLKDGIAKFFTELSLKKNGMYTEKTAECIEKPEELCTLIYDEMVEWTNTSDVAEKSKIVQGIADANGVDLLKLHEKIVFDWISDVSAKNNFDNMDMNDTMGENSLLEQQAEAQGPSDDFKLPLFERVVDKMVVLCKTLEKKRILEKLCNIVIRGGRHANGGYQAVARSACLALRAYTNEEVEAWYKNASHFAICQSLETQLYERLYDMNDVRCDNNTDKFQLIRSLMQMPSRTPSMTALIACLINDEEYKEVKNIDQIMARLQISKQWDVLKMLLNYVRENNMDSQIRSFALLWFRVYENALIGINGGSSVNQKWNSTQCVLLRKWSLWSMGCNVEGGRQNSITRTLRDLSCPAAASIISVLSCFTIEKMENFDPSTADPLRDIPLAWAKTKNDKDNRMDSFRDVSTGWSKIKIENDDRMEH